MTIKNSKLIFSILASAFIFTTSFSAQASKQVHSGTNCEAANQSQANLMTWSKDGLANNSPLDLYVICPIDVDANHWDATPVLEVGASVYMPAGYGSRFTQGPTCTARIMWSSSLFGSERDGSYSNLAATSFTVGSYNPTNILGAVSIATNGDDANEEVDLTPIVGAFLDDAESAELFSAHLLCLLPKNGGKIVAYHSYQK